MVILASLSVSHHLYSVVSVHPRSSEYLPFFTSL